MRVWAVLDLTEAAPWAADLVDDLGSVADGVVTVDATRSGFDGRPGAAAASLADAALTLDDTVDVVVLATVECLTTFGVQLVADLLDELEPADVAVMRGQPVTDALKLVAPHSLGGDRLVESVDRSGLVSPAAPQVIRRDALVAECVAEPLLASRDVAAALVRGGHRVRVLPGGAHHHVHAARSAASGA